MEIGQRVEITQGSDRGKVGIIQHVREMPLIPMNPLMSHVDMKTREPQIISYVVKLEDKSIKSYTPKELKCLDN